MKRRLSNIEKGVIISVISGLILLFIGSAATGWNETLVKRSTLLKYYLTDTQISEKYALSEEIAVIDGKLDLILNHYGLTYNYHKEKCQVPPCNKKLKDKQMVTTDPNPGYY